MPPENSIESLLFCYTTYMKVRKWLPCLYGVHTLHCGPLSPCTYPSCTVVWMRRTFRSCYLRTEQM